MQCPEDADLERQKTGQCGNTIRWSVKNTKEGLKYRECRGRSFSSYLTEVLEQITECGGAIYKDTIFITKNRQIIKGNNTDLEGKIKRNTFKYTLKWKWIWFM